MLITGLFSSIFGCRPDSQSNDLITIIANQTDEEGWQDLIFNITEKNLESNVWNLKCQGLYHGEKVGFRISILESIEAGINVDGIDNTKFLNSGIQIESIGEQSDKLIQILSKLYKQPISLKFTNERLDYTVFPLNREKANLENGRFHFKLFFDDEDERGLYSELFVNPNFPKETLEFNEKDMEYRTNIIKSMSEN